MGPPGQYLTSLYSSGSDRPVTLEPGISIQPHLSHEQENAHADNSCNYDRVVRERGRRMTHKMWRVGQEHNVIRIFLNARGCQYAGTGESTWWGRQQEGKRRTARVVSPVMGQAGCSGWEPDCLKPAGTWLTVNGNMYNDSSSFVPLFY